jgi:hypothetical protein
MTPTVSIRDALNDTALLGSTLSGPSWEAWRVLLIASMGEKLTDDERVLFKTLTGREQEPLQRVEELCCVVGRTCSSRTSRSPKRNTLTCGYGRGRRPGLLFPEWHWQRWMALRDSLPLTQRRITSTISSSGNCRCVVGFIHIDLKHLPALERRKSYAFVAIDRVTRYVYMEIHPKRGSPTSVISTSSAATAARNSCWCFPTRPMPPPRISSTGCAQSSPNSTGARSRPACG